MTRPITTVPPDIPPLHLYRQLLRQISYLPPAFSSHIASIVQTRFHKHKRHEDATSHRLARARRSLRHITLANNGDGDRMLKIMAKGFGKTGPRRRALLSSFVVPEGPSSSDTLAAMTSGQTNAPPLAQPGPKTQSEELDAKKKKSMSAEQLKTRAQLDDLMTKAAPRPGSTMNYGFLDKWDRPKLKNFLQSQKRQEAHFPQGVGAWRGINKLDELMHVPRTTIWDKPVPQSRVRRKVASFWKNQADKMMPPLGKGEWELLQRLAAGAQQSGEWEVPKRRTPARLLTEDHDNDTSSPEEDVDELELYAMMSASSVRPGSRVKSDKRLDLASGAFLGKTPRRDLSNRWYRRNYQRIWQQSSHAVKNPNTSKYEFHWGNASSRGTPPSRRQLAALFEDTPDAAK